VEFKQLDAKVKNSSTTTKFLYNYDFHSDSIIATLKKPDSTSSHDHYFMIGKFESDVDYTFTPRKYQNNHLIRGIFFGEFDKGLFYASWAGKNMVSLILDFESGNKKEEWIIVDIYNDLRMDFSWSDYIPFIGFNSKSDIRGIMFPPAILTKTYNRIENVKEGEQKLGFCTCPDGQIYLVHGQEQNQQPDAVNC